MCLNEGRFPKEPQCFGWCVGVSRHFASMKGGSRKNRNSGAPGQPGVQRTGLNEGRFPKEPQSWRWD